MGILGEENEEGIENLFKVIITENSLLESGKGWVQEIKVMVHE